MHVAISRALLDGIVAAARLQPDREQCGLLFGTAARIAGFQPITNVHPEPARHFEIDPAALIAAHRAQRNGGPALIGHYHAHPMGAAVPSATDAAQAAGDGALWLIVSAVDCALWRAVAGGAHRGAFEPVRLCVEPGS